MTPKEQLQNLLDNSDKLLLSVIESMVKDIEAQNSEEAKENICKSYLAFSIKLFINLISEAPPHIRKGAEIVLITFFKSIDIGKE